MGSYLLVVGEFSAWALDLDSQVGTDVQNKQGFFLYQLHLNKAFLYVSLGGNII